MKGLQGNVEFHQAAKGAGYLVATHYTDGAYKTMFLEKVDVYEVVKDGDSNLMPGRKLSEEEKTNLQASSDGKVHVADNGIFNDEAAAEKYANQHGTGIGGPRYYAAFPEAGNGVSEGLVAVHQKVFENDFWGLTNATQETKLEMIQYGRSGLHLDGHSRGSMTIGNAMESLAKDGNQGLLGGTTVSFFGAAYNGEKADALLSGLQNRDAVQDPSQRQAMELTLQIHMADPVGRYIGGNPSAGGTIPGGSNLLYEMWRALDGQENTTHNCYGAPGNRACQALWSNSSNKETATLPISAFEGWK
ncbi:MAG: filamentous hemagglutinin [Rhodanobacter sp.]|nr:MAG: filamentous hemagglutinin [Rhodanobacter sp.]TAM35947.1 MAG: filamentous hemagglutinin [Rhodanobacter sp.]